jgi:GNAT superfamily N-acetyltransferase
VDIIDLRDVPIEEAVDVYAKVFEGPEWYEQEKCAACGKSYPGPASSRRSESYTNGEPCWQCGEPLRLIAFYRDPEDRLAERIITNAMKQESFVGVVARSGHSLVGFSWGYALPSADSPSVLFDRVRDELTRAGISATGLFYAAETGVVPDRQRAGVGEMLVRERLGRAQDAGFDAAVFRTVDRERLVALWEKVLGEGAVSELFGDPDPARDQVWFLGRSSSV